MVVATFTCLTCGQASRGIRRMQVSRSSPACKQACAVEPVCLARGSLLREYDKGTGHLSYVRPERPST